MSRPESLAYKVLTAAEHETVQTDGVFLGAPVDLADGFIHLSTAAELAETLIKHFADQDQLFIAAVDLGALGEAVKWEESRGGQLFPHIYGPLSREAITATFALNRAADGTPDLSFLD